MDKTFFMLMGSPGAGKTTFARANAGKFGAIILSRDALKGFPNANEIYLHQAEYFAEQGVNIILDNLNSSMSDRKPFIDIARKHGYKVQAILLVSQSSSHRTQSWFPIFERPKNNEVDSFQEIFR